MKKVTATKGYTNAVKRAKTKARLKDNGRGVHLSIPMPKKSKYNNKRSLYDGITFDSLKELARYKVLKLLLNAKQIKDLKIHEPFILQCGFTDFEGKKQRPITY